MVALLQRSVTEQVERNPDATALVMREELVSYGQLERFSNQLAWRLKEAGCRRGDRVCLLMPKSPVAIASILGTLKADSIYVPLDPSSPATRLTKMIAACEPRCILASGPSAPLLDEIFLNQSLVDSITVGWMEPAAAAVERFTSHFSLADVNGCSDRAIDYQNSPNDPAYILFTSGSTGDPKGVVITHSNVTHFVNWAIRYFGVNRNDRNSSHPPLHFDLSAFDIFGTLAAGAQLHLVPAELNLLPNKIADFIRTSELTQWFSVPSLLNFLAKFDAVQFHDFPSLKRLLWCGEVFPTPALIYWMQRLPHVSFTNLYGPTEATIASSYYTVPRCPVEETASIPIGTPCDGEELLVLDDELRPTAPDEVGDLYICGAGVSPGYWRDAEKTQAVFLSNPSGKNGFDRIYKTGDLAKIGDDGLVYFRGRADSQIKSRGYRIELGEIETALNALNVLEQCAVVAITSDGFEGTIICCAYVPLADAGINPIVLREKLSKLLPSYMMPTRWMAFDGLPINANGKIDRRRVKENFQQSVGPIHSPR
jgi:amino acid adenylation domain-containing protein